MGVFPNSCVITATKLLLLKLLGGPLVNSTLKVN